MLLTPEEIKNEKKETVDQSQKLVTALSAEEAKLNKALSLVRENAKIETDRIKTATDNFVAEQETRVSDIRKEVDALEARRAEAMKPIEDVRAEADKYLEKAKKALTRATQKEADAEDVHQENLDFIETLKDREDELIERENKVTSREEMATVEDNRLKDNATSLAEKWVEYYKKVEETNKDIKKREDKVRGREKVLDITRQQLDERETEINHLDTLVKDKYATFGRTVGRMK